MPCPMQTISFKYLNYNSLLIWYKRLFTKKTTNLDSHIIFLEQARENKEKTKLKLSAVPTLFSHSNPKQKRECSIKRRDIGAKKQVVNMFRSNHVQNL